MENLFGTQTELVIVACGNLFLIFILVIKAVVNDYHVNELKERIEKLEDKKAKEE
ncbi:hypothetical protein M0R19_04915 [Candidatus Pacearchaeota archaeon]|jgi:hypothetical protein|nr:hypothetical protein [Candidatus Pacearchaeota archaeon]